MTFGAAGTTLDVRPGNIRPQLTKALDNMGLQYVNLYQPARRLGVKVVVYGAVGHGVLTDKAVNGGLSNPMADRGILSPDNREHNLRALNKLAHIAEKLGLSVSEIALAWTQAKYDNILSLIGTTKTEHLLSSIKAVNTILDAATIAELESVVSCETIKGIAMRKWFFENGVGRLI